MEIEINPRVKEVIASMKIEGFALDEDDILALQQLDNGEKSIDELIETILARYQRGPLTKNG